MPRHVFTLCKTWRKTQTANRGRKKARFVAWLIA